MTTRRNFLKASLATGAALAAPLGIARSAHAAGVDGFRVGLIGCGGRGCGAAVNATNAGHDVKVVAMADLFEDQLNKGYANLKRANESQVQVGSEHRFFGFDAYKKLLESDINVVVIAAASHFHPVFFRAAIGAGKHVFVEKPHALDVPGIKSVIETCELAEKKGLAVVSGLCWRYDQAVREAMQRVEDGAIGDIIAIQEYYVGGPYHATLRQPPWSELEFQLRNWYHFNWLSGDQTAQQLIHSIDKSSWALGDVPPVKAWGLGGRQVCLEPKYGDQFDHAAVVFDYPNGVPVYAYCRDIPGCFNQTSDTILGTKGRAVMPRRCRIEDRQGNIVWRAPDSKVNMYDNEHKEMFESIRQGQPINNGNYMVTSSMLAILAQMVAYTGQEISWERAMTSTRDFSLPEYSWDAKPPVKPRADGTYDAPMPGITDLV